MMVVCRQRHGQDGRCNARASQERREVGDTAIFFTGEAAAPPSRPLPARMDFDPTSGKKKS
eukprot:scaffold299507_cov24-Tisochrysis_lutea.AAC.1